MTLVAPTFGLCSDPDGVQWLVQAQMPAQNAVGLRELPEVKCAIRGARCPHRIKLFETKLKQKHIFDEASGPVWYDDLNEAQDLMQAYAPVQFQSMVPAWLVTEKLMLITNVMPLCVYGIEIEDLPLIKRLITMQSTGTRKLVLLGSEEAYRFMKSDVERVRGKGTNEMVVAELLRKMRGNEYA